MHDICPSLSNRDNEPSFVCLSATIITLLATGVQTKGDNWDRPYYSKPYLNRDVGTFSTAPQSLIIALGYPFGHRSDCQGLQGAVWLLSGKRGPPLEKKRSFLLGLHLEMCYKMSRVLKGWVFDVEVRCPIHLKFP